MPENVRPFSSGTEGLDWCEANCERCQLNGYKRGGEPCPMEQAVAEGFIRGTIPADLAVGYGATVTSPGFCRMPRQCARFVPPATCERIMWPGTRRRRSCGGVAVGEVEVHGLRHAVCARHWTEPSV